MPSSLVPFQEISGKPSSDKIRAALDDAQKPGAELGEPTEEKDGQVDDVKHAEAEELPSSRSEIESSVGEVSSMSSQSSSASSSSPKKKKKKSTKKQEAKKKPKTEKAAKSQPKKTASKAEKVEAEPAPASSSTAKPSGKKKLTPLDTSGQSWEMTWNHIF